MFAFLNEKRWGALRSQIAFARRGDLDRNAPIGLCVGPDRAPTAQKRRFFMPAIKFRGVDFIQYDSLLTEEERLVRDTTRQFIEDNLIPIIEECNRAGRFPRELVKPMAYL